MLKIFRNLRRKLLSDNKTSKYTIYAIGEIFLVVVGILIALQINNWNEIKNNQTITNKYLSGFISDLKKDKTQLESLIYVRKKQSQNAKALLSMVEADEYDLDEFYNHYYFLFPFYRFIPNSNTLEEVLNSSHLRFITDEGIKNRLLDLRGSYKSIQLNEEHVYEDRAIYLYSPLTMNHLELNGLFIADTGFEVEKREASFSKSKDVEVYKKDVEYLMKDRHFKSFINLLDFNLIFVIPQLEKARSDCESIISLIEEKLQEN
ncbi:MAG: hypothetical protein KC469_13815 [Flavobacteriaceae bacterium]|nr:hypothetical protein [Flavobacteriaceae bacterium]